MAAKQGVASGGKPQQDLHLIIAQARADRTVAGGKTSPEACSEGTTRIPSLALQASRTYLLLGLSHQQFFLFRIPLIAVARRQRRQLDSVRIEHLLLELIERERGFVFGFVEFVGSGDFDFKSDLFANGEKGFRGVGNRVLVCAQVIEAATLVRGADTGLDRFAGSRRRIGQCRQSWRRAFDGWRRRRGHRYLCFGRRRSRRDGWRQRLRGSYRERSWRRHNRDRSGRRRSIVRSWSIR